MKRLAIGLLAGAAGYALAAITGYFLVDALSTNTHDRAVEAAMTGAFVFGPVGAVAGFITGFVRAGRSRQPQPAQRPQDSVHHRL
jgi:hypothetical protein